MNLFELVSYINFLCCLSLINILLQGIHIDTIIDYLV